MRLSLLSVLIFSSVMALPVAAEDWPQFRGLNRDGISLEKGWTTAWPASGPKKLWTFDIGKGHSSVAVADGRLFTLGNSNRKTDTLWCLNPETGQKIWSYPYPCREWDREGGPCSTPTIDGDHVYTLSRDGDLFCFEAATGKVLWSKNAKKDFGGKAPLYGYTCSALILGKMLITNIGPADDVIVALDKTDGSLLWKSGKEEAGYSSPVAYKRGKEDRVAVMTGTALLGINAADGRVLWRYPWLVQNGNAVAMPVLADGQAFISTDYNMGSAAVPTTEEGAAGKPVNGTTTEPAVQPKPVWENKEMSTHYNTCVLWQGYLYGFDGDNYRQACLRCLEFKTGKERWKDRSLGKGSLTVADGKLLILGEKGDLIVAQASPGGFKPLSRAKVLDGKCWTAPVLVGGRIYCRNHEGTLVCLDVKADPAGK